MLNCIIKKLSFNDDSELLFYVSLIDLEVVSQSEHILTKPKVFFSLALKRAFGVYLAAFEKKKKHKRKWYKIFQMCTK